MVSASDKQSVVCPHCHGKLNVPARLAGKTVACPKCKRTFPVPAPASGDDNKPNAEGHPVICSGCHARLRVSADKVGRQGVCPRCQKRTRFENAMSAQEEFDLSKADGNLLGKEVFLAQGEEVRSFTIMKDIEESRKDAYGVALLKAVVYPFQQIGAIIFFVVGIPFAIMATQWIGRKVIDTSEPGNAVIQYAVTAGMLLAPLAMASFLCSFILGVVRVSALGRSATPVVQGMPHRANLAALCAWMAAYLGLGILAAYKMAPPGEAFAFTPVSVGLLLIGGFFAPMGLLCTATISVSGGLNVVRVAQAVGTAFGPYIKCWGAVVLSVGVYGLLFRGLTAWADGASSMYLAGVLRFAGYLCLPMPLVTLGRAVGLLAQYHADALPFELDLFADSKGGTVPNLVALAGVLFLFMPVHAGVVQYDASMVAVKTCRDRMGAISSALSGREGVHVDVVDEADLAKKIGEDRMKCPLTEEQIAKLPNAEALRSGSFYGVVKLPPGRELDSNLVIVYEKASVFPDGRKVHLLMRSSVNGVKAYRLDDVNTLVDLIDRMREAKDEGTRLRLGKEYATHQGYAEARSAF